MRSRRTTTRFLAALVLAGGALAAAPAEARRAPSARPAPVPSPAPALPPVDPTLRPDFGWLAPQDREAARRSLAEHDAKVAAALTAADREHAALRDPKAHAVPPRLPKTAKLDGGAPADPVTLPPLTPPGAKAHVGGYQSDHLWLTDHPDDAYASDYYVWLAIPQANETNQCDSASSTRPCFWFYSMQYDTAPGSAIHIGPQRGTSLAGTAGPNWRMNIDGYNDGNHVGGQSATNLPTAKWIRVRTWRTSNTATTATFGVWALWDGTDRYLGSVTINGTSITHSLMFMEVYEDDTNGQCSTDLERGYLQTPTVWRGDRAFTFPTATTNYQANCGNTSWRRLSGAPDFVVNEREVARTVPQDTVLWDRRSLDYNWDAYPHLRNGTDLRVVIRPRGWITQPFVASKSMFDHVSFVAGCGSCVVTVHIYANREVNQPVCSLHNVQVNDNVFTHAFPDWCLFTPGRYYYLQIFNDSYTRDATMYLVDNAGGNSLDFAYVANAGPMPGSTALRSLIFTRDQ